MAKYALAAAGAGVAVVSDRTKSWPAVTADPAIALHVVAAPEMTQVTPAADPATLSLKVRDAVLPGAVVN